MINSTNSTIADRKLEWSICNEKDFKKIVTKSLLYNFDLRFDNTLKQDIFNPIIRIIKVNLITNNGLKCCFLIEYKNKIGLVFFAICGVKNKVQSICYQYYTQDHVNFIHQIETLTNIGLFDIFNDTDGQFKMSQTFSYNNLKTFLDQTYEDYINHKFTMISLTIIISLFICIIFINYYIYTNRALI